MRDFTKAMCLIVLCLFSFSCRSSRKEEAGGENSKDKVQQIPPIGETIPPNHCRIVATVVAIDSSYRSGNSSDPCSKAPCRASVRVEEIVGYGPAFTRPLAVGEVIPVSFAFTVAPTKDLFPNMTQSYPGVRVGTRITTDVQGLEDIVKEGGPHVSFSIYDYKVK